jgi:hypothetical protein
MGEQLLGNIYYVQLLEKLIRRIQRKRENMEVEGIFHLHDNATPHTSRISREAISRLCLDSSNFPTRRYSPDLAPFD